MVDNSPFIDKCVLLQGRLAGKDAAGISKVDVSIGCLQTLGAVQQMKGEALTIPIKVLRLQLRSDA